MPVFSLLKDPAGYIPCSTEDMLTDHAYREFWLSHFAEHFDSVVQLARENYGPEAMPRIRACQADFLGLVEKLRQTPALFGPLDLLILDQLRQDKLIEHGIPDPYEKTKRRENAAALKLYPGIVAELDSHRDPREALLLAIEGIFAGNIFDLGAIDTVKMFSHQSPDFLAIRAGLHAKRPWLVDHFAALAGRLLSGPPHRQAIFFADNAGPDLLLGVVPFCRLLAGRGGGGMRVLIAANHLPALNDTTFAELVELLTQLRDIDPVLVALIDADLIAPLDSGGTCPLIDLRLISPELNVQAALTDLVILEGMGRALESNYEARFTVDAVKLAMIKTSIVAERHGGQLFDTICRFDPA